MTSNLAVVNGCCPFCKNSMIHQDGALICENDGIEIPEGNIDVMQTVYAGGRDVASPVVLGNGLGMNHSTRNPDGSSNIYALRGDNGKFGDVSTEKRIAKLRPSNVPEDRWGTMKTTIIDSSREFNFAGLEESDPSMVMFKMSLSRTLTRKLKAEKVSQVAEPLIKEKMRRLEQKDSLTPLSTNFLYDRIGDPLGSPTKKICPKCLSPKHLKWNGSKYICMSSKHEQALSFGPNEVIVKKGRAAVGFAERFLAKKISDWMENPFL